MRERHYSTIILSYCWRPQGHRTRGPEDHRTRGPGDQRTTGPEDHRTRGIFFFQGLYFFSRAVCFFSRERIFFSSVIPCLKTQRQGISCLKDKYCFLGQMISNCFYTWKNSYKEGTVYFPKNDGRGNRKLECSERWKHVGTGCPRFSKITQWIWGILLIVGAVFSKIDLQLPVFSWSSNK